MKASQRQDLQPILHVFYPDQRLQNDFAGTCGFDQSSDLPLFGQLDSNGYGDAYGWLLKAEECRYMSDSAGELKPRLTFHRCRTFVDIYNQRQCRISDHIITST